MIDFLIFQEVTMRLNLGEDINQKLYPRFSAPLHDATICGRTEVAKLLIERYICKNILSANVVS